MRRNSPAESGSLSSVPKDERRFKAGSSRETVLRGTDAESSVVFAAVLFSRLKYGQFWIVVRAQDVGSCDFGSWHRIHLCRNLL
jgi:hypothetical protein